jgi:molecular chaperone DnaK
MVKDAQSHAEDDKRRKEAAEARNEADTAIYSVEKSLQEFGDKLPESERTAITDKIAETKKALESNDPAAIRAAVSALQSASHKLAEEMYKKTAGSGAQAGAGPSGAASETDAAPPKDDNVVDAQYEEVDKDKK